MELVKEMLGWILALALGLLSALMVFDGFAIYARTSGVVQGSEFGMLIALVNQISLIMVWLGLFALRSLLVGSKRASE